MILEFAALCPRSSPPSDGAPTAAVPAASVPRIKGELLMLKVPFAKRHLIEYDGRSCVPRNTRQDTLNRLMGLYLSELAFRAGVGDADRVASDEALLAQAKNAAIRHESRWGILPLSSWAALLTYRGGWPPVVSPGSTRPALLPSPTRQDLSGLHGGREPVSFPGGRNHHRQRRIPVLVTACNMMAP